MTKQANVTEMVKRNGKWAIVGKVSRNTWCSGSRFYCCSVRNKYDDSEEREEIERMNEMEANRVSTNALADPS